MDHTPERPAREETVTFAIPPDENRSPRRSSRVKKNPSITPNRFNKFFTPRLRNAQHTVRASRKVLRNLSAAHLNSRLNAGKLSTLRADKWDEQPNKKRKLSFTSLSSIPSSPIKKDSIYPSGQETSAEGKDKENDLCDTGEEDEEDESCAGSTFPPRLVPYRALSSSASILSRRIEGRKTVTETNDSSLWQHETANFYSSPEDSCLYEAPIHQLSALPFSAASFKTVSLVAIGDEDGSVRIHDAVDPTLPFNKIFMTLHPHDNAVMDMELSPDDSLIATASGDQTCRITDMRTQVPTHTLIGHTGSVKCVQFQPGSGNNVLTTCSRDGSICLWDLRCARAKGSSLPKIFPSSSALMIGEGREVNPVNHIRDAHTSCDRFHHVKGKRQRNAVSARYGFAIMSCTFISESRPHLLATASDNDAAIKLWDMRTSYNKRSGRPTPVSVTLEPQSHENHRQFGVTSIAMGTDGSRLYSLCRDHTVYAYSTPHLVVGGAPEMASSSSHPFRQSRSAGQGLGPLYGFRHPALRLATFYDKLALRQRTEDKTEMIATGTSEGCAVIFPTDERYLNMSTQRPPLPTKNGVGQGRDLPRETSNLPLLSGVTVESDRDSCPIYHHGAGLVNGHQREVTAVAWALNGNLITTADDCTTRCWREDADRARALRLNTDRDLMRNQSGWAEVRDGYDDDEA
ncbi:uncharacterized protein Z518_03228 [Rhinocladiella mackenziei CBS 650.93]|uniref:WD repeat protein n=1 Tax=Rhinocladiella mackenziei CBS 650.93 TaxID=1442369 RepID=A0A0D2G256_9EURO|nr:uncharacterized protein Z518_03228 [Rhinocladiella mackenziei CBS 650.93]KIX08572.1 hypothetical protein Z518_03228 [Rhinocladiella mackenziei CBS 650.93]